MSNIYAARAIGNSHYFDIALLPAGSGFAPGDALRYITPGTTKAQHYYHHSDNFSSAPDIGTTPELSDTIAIDDSVISDSSSHSPRYLLTGL